MDSSELIGFAYLDKDGKEHQFSLTLDELTDFYIQNKIKPELEKK
jgi:hypothetical protein